MEALSSPSIWILAIRPKTLIASLSPILIGTILAFDKIFDPLMFLATLFAALFVQIGTNIANDYYDFIQGADTNERKGPKRVTQSGLLPPYRVKQGFIFSFLLASLFGLYPMVKGGLSIILIGIISIFLGIYYTKGKYSIAYTGLGDIFVVFFFGILSTGFSYYLQTLMFSPLAFLAGLGPGCLSTAILCLNNIRDEESDKKVNKNTLIVRFGRRFGEIEYTFCLGISFLVLSYFSPYTSWIFLFYSAFLIKTLYSTQDKKELIILLEKTAKLLFLYTLLFLLHLA